MRAGGRSLPPAPRVTGAAAAGAEPGRGSGWGLGCSRPARPSGLPSADAAERGRASSPPGGARTCRDAPGPPRARAPRDLELTTVLCELGQATGRVASDPRFCVMAPPSASRRAAGARVGEPLGSCSGCWRADGKTALTAGTRGARISRDSEHQLVLPWEVPGPGTGSGLQGLQTGG